MAFFAESDFYYRTAAPDTRAEWEINALLADDTRVLCADGEPVGLYSVENVGSDHGCHYLLNLRLRAAAPLEWWREVYHEIIRTIQWRRELVRITLLVGEFDVRGLAAARSLGITEEGTLAEIVAHEGRRYGNVFFAQVWATS